MAKKILPPLKAVIYFESFARNGSIQKASEELCITNSAITHQLRQLENWVGYKLFERSNHGLELTDAGRRYKTEVTAVVNRLEKASSSNVHAEKKTLTIQTTDSFAARWLVHRLREFEQIHSELVIKIVTCDYRDSFRSSEADIGILFSNECKDKESRLLFYEEIFPVCNPKYLKDPNLSKADLLMKIPLIHDENVGVTWNDWLVEAGKAENISVQLDTKTGTRYNRAHLALKSAELENGMTLASNILAGDSLAKNTLVAPFKTRIKTGRGYYLFVSEHAELKEDICFLENWIINKCLDFYKSIEI